MSKKLAFLILLLAIMAQPGFGWMVYSMADPPDSGILANSFVDILYHENTVWLAGGRGLSQTEDFGQTWVTYTTASGLNSSEPSAIYGRPGQVWIAGSHTEMYDGYNYPFGDGFNVTYDNGLTWESSIPIDSSASKVARLVYDITGTDSSTYAAAFYGGLIVSHDFGNSWKHLFFSPIDSADWEADSLADLATGRYYACAADTFHTDTTIIWGGSGGGIHKFYYLPKQVKLGGNEIYDIVGDTGLNLVYLAHEGGVTRSDSGFTYWLSADTVNGLPTNQVNQLALFGGRLWAAVFDPSDGAGLGLYVSSDSALTWTKAVTGLFEGPGTGIFDFKSQGDSILYAAAGDSGAFRTLDSGLTWQRFYVDSADTDQASPRNQVYALDLTDDSLFLGTKAGLVGASYLPPFDIDYDTLITFPEDDTSGSFVSAVFHYDDDSTSFTWVGLQPQTPSGNHAACFLDSLGAVAMIFGPTIEVPVHIYDFSYIDSVTIIASSAGLWYGANNRNLFPYQLSVVDAVSGLILNSFEFLTTDVLGDRLYTGTTHGFAYATTYSDWKIFTANTDPKAHDLAVARTHANSGLPGDWVVAMDVQVHDSDTLIWAACRRVSDTTDTVAQVSAVAFSTDFGDSWNEVLTNKQVWNFAFDDNGNAYAAATEGLYSAPPPWTDWTRSVIIDPATEDTIVEETEIYAVEVVEEFGGTWLWVGTGLGLAKRPLDPDSDWEITRVFKETESSDDVFASPVPYSPINNVGRLSIHYRVEATADITVEVYDFAMNLVKVLAENRPRTGGSDYFETWDGYNESGDMVATGMYFFKVSYSTGEHHWGRLAIIP